MLCGYEKEGYVKRAVFSGAGPLTAGEPASVESRCEAPVPEATGSPEIALLLCCARSRGSSRTAERIHDLLRADLNWDYLLRAAREHGMASLLYWHLDGVSPESVPEDVLLRLRGHFQANHLHSLYLTGELLKLLGELEARGIAAIPYKGPALSAAAYGNLALREFGDLDILVREEDVIGAADALRSLGYRAQYEMSRAQETAFLRYERQYQFSRDDGSTVELHWKITSRHTSFALTPEYLWERARRVSLGGGVVPAFPPEELLLTLCVHGSLHRWESLKWVCDIAELLSASENLDWERLEYLAGALNSRRMLRLGLVLSSDLLEATKIPNKLLFEARNDPAVKSLAAEVRERLFREDPVAGEDFERFPYWRFQLRVTERLRDRLRYCLRRATTPGLLDWETVPLPAALFRFYRLLRPMRLAGRFGRGLAQRLLRSGQRTPETMIGERRECDV